MIGTGYWATGITVKRRGPDGTCWVTYLDFHDDGFSNDDIAAGEVSTQGRFANRYPAREAEDKTALATVLDVLIADAQRLGIEFRRTNGTPELYIDEGDPGAYQPLDHVYITEQAERLGWRHLVPRGYQLGSAGVRDARLLFVGDRLAALGPDTLEKLYRWHVGCCHACNYDVRHTCNCSHGWGNTVRQLAQAKGVVI
jgi:hypothetical protein